MASGGIQFNESSANEGISPRSTKRKEPPSAFELINISAPRDSGCYTGSPMAALRSPSDRSFVYDDPLGSTMVDENTPYSDDDDDVFQMSEDSFIDSGIHHSCSLLPDGSQVSSFKTSKHYKQGEQSGYTDAEEEESTTSEDYSTPEFDLEEDESTVSSPIDIPARSRNSTPDAADEQVEAAQEVVFRRANLEPELAPLPLLQRRATVAQMDDLERFGGRIPVLDASARTRCQYYNRGEQGPLPDVVPERRRPRAMSESAIHPHLVRVGVSLRNISDEFSTMTLNKQRNLNLIQSRQQRQSLSPANKKPGFLSRLFSSSHE